MKLGSGNRMEIVCKMLDGYEFENGYGPTKHNSNVSVNDDFLCCPRCNSVELTMDATFISHRSEDVGDLVVYDNNGVIAEFTCNICTAQITLALFNDDVGRPQPTARINWVHKELPYTPTAIDKLRSYSLTGYSKKLKEHVDKYDLWDVEIGSDASVPFNPEEYDVPCP